jgi:hypothetical protein
VSASLADQSEAVRYAVNFDFNQAFVAESWVILRGCKNLKAAMNFITFSLQAAPQVEFAEVIPYGLVNRKALASLDKQRLAVLPHRAEFAERRAAEFCLLGAERFRGWRTIQRLDSELTPTSQDRGRMSKRGMHLVGYVIAAPTWHHNGAWLKGSRMPSPGENCA